MPTLNKRYVKKSRKSFICDDCGKHISKGSSYVYLYGMAYCDEKPYSLHFCNACNNEHEELKANE